MSDVKKENIEKLLQEKEDELARYKSEIGRLNLQLRDLIQQISTEVKTAHLIQRALVPTDIPTIPGFDFSTKFVASFISGGDYFDIFEHDDRFRFGVIFSCSSGHGMSALFLSVLMKLAGPIEAKKSSDSAKSLQALASELTPNMPPEDSSDIFYGVIDRRTFELHYTMAGDVVALRFDHREHGVARLRSHSAALTNKFQTALTSDSLALNGRDRVVICSRGIFEAQSPQGEKFGIKRIEDCIFSKKDTSVHELRNEILFQVEKFTNSHEPQRDQTILVLEVKDRVLKLARQ